MVPPCRTDRSCPCVCAYGPALQFMFTKVVTLHARKHTQTHTHKHTHTNIHTHTHSLTHTHTHTHTHKHTHTNIHTHTLSHTHTHTHTHAHTHIHANTHTHTTHTHIHTNTHTPGAERHRSCSRSVEILHFYGTVRIQTASHLRPEGAHPRPSLQFNKTKWSPESSGLNNPLVPPGFQRRGERERLYRLSLSDRNTNSLQTFPPARLSDYSCSFTCN